MELSDAEAAIVQQPFVQRLRGIRQVGYSYIPFPGATHSRFAHCLGVMHLAGLAFDRAYRGWEFTGPAVRERLRAAVRLAALSHDLGHAPYSHCTEFAMPPVDQLGITWYRNSAAKRRATHEDYTIAILQHASLNRAIGEGFPCTAQHVAALISGDVRVTDDFFVDGGLDHRRLLSQLISSDLDVDRLDYLVRDATFTGAQYGLVDVKWILSSLSTHVAHGQVWLAVDGLGLYAVDDFLVARHHMFLQVYFHHKSVVYEEMLKRYVQEASGDWSIPADLDAYLWVDDAHLEVHLRGATNTWARRIVEHREYRRVVERRGSSEQVSVDREEQLLRRAGIEPIRAESTGRLSRYALHRRAGTELFVKERLPGQATTKVQPLTEATQVFERYGDAHRIARLYVAPEERSRAMQALGLTPR